MRGRWVGAALLAVVLVTAGSVLAQQRRQAPAFEHDPDLDAADQLAPSQIEQQMPPAVALPTGPSTPAGKHTAAHSTEIEPEAKPHSRRERAAHVVTCSGVFAQDSSHQKLAMAFDTRNVAYTQVDADSGTKPATVLYAKDPKRRLEVWWTDPISRSHTHLIVINGQSAWGAPGGLSLGLTLPEVEKLNGKPFKVLGFSKGRVAALSDWDGGALATPPGGCKLGLSLRADANASASALAALPAEHEYASGDTALRAVNPTVSEILVGY
jgi:hypothetical protein